jgi:cystathionine beta-lyase/cystathionine gamma-synthase
MTKIRSGDLAHGFATRAVHSGQIPDPMSGAVMTPIYQTSTYAQEGLGKHKGYEYARTQNPTREALERNVASLEGGSHGFAFSSGLAALDGILKLFKAGDHVICGANVYGGSHRLMERLYTNFGLTFSFADMRDIRNVERVLTPATRLIYGETPTNPMMHLSDLAALGDLAQAHGYLFAVDNTFATPCFQQPLAFGADIVLHSTTKYLNGHSDMIGGMLVVNRDDLAERLGFIQNASGAVPGPMDCWLCLRGTKTLPLRMARHDESGRRIAQWLSERKDISKVYYPGLPSNPQFELAKKQMKGFGGMIAFDVSDPARARRVVEKLELFTLAESLGGVESLVGHPASMTHAAVPQALRLEMGLTDSLLRLSVGVEEVDDLIEDLDRAMT